MGPRAANENASAYQLGVSTASRPRIGWQAFGEASPWEYPQNAMPPAWGCLEPRDELGLVTIVAVFRFAG